MLFLQFNTFILRVRGDTESIKMILGILVDLADLCDMLNKGKHLVFAHAHLVIRDVIANNALLFLQAGLSGDLSQILNLVGGGDALLRLHKLNEDEEILKLFSRLVWIERVHVLNEETVKRAFLCLLQLNLTLCIHFYYLYLQIRILT